MNVDIVKISREKYEYFRGTTTASPSIATLVSTWSKNIHDLSKKNSSLDVYAPFSPINVNIYGERIPASHEQVSHTACLNSKACNRAFRPIYTRKT